MKNSEEKNLDSQIERFHQPVDPMAIDRIPVHCTPYLGERTLEEARAVILSGGNLLLIGEKSTGKNILAEYLAGLFCRPLYTISFHVATDAESLIGTDTLKGGEVTYRPGPITQAATYGGFCVLDEINMAKNEAVSVLHATLDHRRLIDIPGYKPVRLHPFTRFIATMNQGYAGTRAVNRALLSRFNVIRMPLISEEGLAQLLKMHFPKLREEYVHQFTLFFFEIVLKHQAGEISDRPVDLRGLIDAISLVHWGLPLGRAIDLGITNKSDDEFERTLVRDLVDERFLAEDGKDQLFQ